MPRTYTPEQKERMKLANRAYAKRKREANREQHREERRQYRARNRAKVYERNRKWALENPEKVREYHRKSRKKNPDSYRETALRWRAKNPDARATFCANRRAKKAAVGGVCTDAEWAAIKMFYGNVCLRCGENKPLTRDHVIPIDKGGDNNPSNIQPLCLECNSSKGTKTTDYRKTKFVASSTT